MNDSSTGKEEEGFLVDGNIIEGGGQLLRSSVAYSVLLGRQLRLTAFRTRRSPPGLRSQHLKGIETVRDLCQGTLVGAKLLSIEFSFIPRQLLPSGTNLRVDIETAGSIPLLIHTILPVLLFQPPTYLPGSPATVKPSTLTILGGTNVTWAPPIDYFIHVFLPMAERMFGSGRVSVEIIQRGYYPKGGGKVQLGVWPLSHGDSLNAIDLTERGEVTRIRGYIFVAGSNISFTRAWGVHKHVMKNLELAGFGKERFPSLEKDLSVVKEGKAESGAFGALLWAETERGCVIAGSSLGARKTESETVAEEATSQLIKNLTTGGCVDEFLQDQLIVLMVLAKGRSRIMTGPITSHTETSIIFARELTGVVVEVEKLDDGRCILECEGLGFCSSAPSAFSQNS